MNNETTAHEAKTNTRPPGFGLGIVLMVAFFVGFQMMGLGGLIGGALAGGLGMGIGVLVGKAFSSNGPSST